jgi:putative flippase GtrA
MAKFITPKVKELIRFVFVGGVMTVINFALLAFFKEFIGMNYMIANVVSYIIAVILSYFINVIFTFKQQVTKTKEEWSKLVKYCIMKLIILGMDSACLYIMVSKIEMNIYIGKLILTVVFTFASFGISKIIVLEGKNYENNRL